MRPQARVCEIRPADHTEKTKLDLADEWGSSAAVDEGAVREDGTRRPHGNVFRGHEGFDGSGFGKEPNLRGFLPLRRLIGAGLKDQEPAGRGVAERTRSSGPADAMAVGHPGVDGAGLEQAQRHHEREQRSNDANRPNPFIRRQQVSFYRDGSAVLRDGLPAAGAGQYGGRFEKTRAKQLLGSTTTDIQALVFLPSALLLLTIALVF